MTVKKWQRNNGISHSILLYYMESKDVFFTQKQTMNTYCATHRFKNRDVWVATDMLWQRSDLLIICNTFWVPWLLPQSFYNSPEGDFGRLSVGKQENELGNINKGWKQQLFMLWAHHSNITKTAKMRKGDNRLRRQERSEHLNDSKVKFVNRSSTFMPVCFLEVSSIFHY